MPCIPKINCFIKTKWSKCFFVLTISHTTHPYLSIITPPKQQRRMNKRFHNCFAGILSRSLVPSATSLRRRLSSSSSPCNQTCFSVDTFTFLYMMMMMMTMTIMTNIIPYWRTKTHIWEKVLMGIWASAIGVTLMMRDTLWWSLWWWSPKSWR